MTHWEDGGVAKRSHLIGEYSRYTATCGGFVRRVVDKRDALPSGTSCDRRRKRCHARDCGDYQLLRLNLSYWLLFLIHHRPSGHSLTYRHWDFRGHRAVMGLLRDVIRVVPCFPCRLRAAHCGFCTTQEPLVRAQWPLWPFILESLIMNQLSGTFDLMIGRIHVLPAATIWLQFTIVSYSTYCSSCCYLIATFLHNIPADAFCDQQLQ